MKTNNRHDFGNDITNPRESLSKISMSERGIRSGKRNRRNRNNPGPSNFGNRGVPQHYTMSMGEPRQDPVFESVSSDEVVSEEMAAVDNSQLQHKKRILHTFRSFDVTTNSVSVMRSGAPISIYKYDMKYYWIRKGERKQAPLNKDEVVSLMKGLMDDPDAKEAMKGIFWSDFKSLFYSKYSIPETTYKLKVGSDDVELVIHPTEVVTLTRMDEADERVIQAISNALMYETVVEKDTFCLPGKIFSGSVFKVDNFIQGRLGVNYAFRNTERGMLMEIDQCATCFIIPGPLVNVLRSVAGNNMSPQFQINEKSLRDVNKLLRHVKVYTTYQGYKHKYTFNQLVKQNALEATFENEGKKVTVASYMKEKYNITLKYPRANLAETTKKCLIPIELLNVSPNQRYQTLLTPFQTSTIIRTTASPPSNRQSLVRDFMSSGQSDFRLLKALDISLEQTPQHVRGYQLPSPMQRGDSNRKYAGKALNSYVCVILDRKNGEKVMKDLFKDLPKFISMKMNMPVITCSINQVESRLAQTISTMRSKPNLLFFFLPQHATSEYKEVKRISDVVFKIPSQCVNCWSLRRGPSRSYAGNISLKINAKLGGVNSVLSNPPCENYMMVCGADVTHPMAGEKNISIASIVGSFDVNCTQYASESSVQTGRKEIIENMQTMMQGLFNRYYRHNQHVPNSVLFYRDGVGDSMFNIIMHEEVPKIYLAFRNCFPQWEHPLKLTFLVCQKRHCMKLFPSEKDKNGNARPGLLIDEEIVSKEKTEFYLQSAVTLNGTGRSCRYTVLVDDNDFSLEKLETLTFHICFLFNRCNGSIGICAPARYAHHLCFRTRDILRVSDGDDARSVGSRGSSSSLSKAFDYDSSMKEKMFYI